MTIVRTVLSIIILGLGLNVSAQKKETKNSEQRLVVLNYPDSTVKCDIMITPVEIKVQEQLEYFWYYTDALKSNIGGYSGFLLHGKYNVFDLQNNLIVSGYFKNGLRNGVWKRWNSKGKLISRTDWENGQIDGVNVIYKPNGETKLYEEYKEGLRHGKHIIYIDGKEELSNYKKGTLTEDKSFFKSKEKKEEEIKEEKVETTDKKDKKRKLFKRKTKEEKEEGKAEEINEIETEMQ